MECVKGRKDMEGKRMYGLREEGRKENYYEEGRKNVRGRKKGEERKCVRGRK